MRPPCGDAFLALQLLLISATRTFDELLTRTRSSWRPIERLQEAQQWLHDSGHLKDEYSPSVSPYGLQG